MGNFHFIVIDAAASDALDLQDTLMCEAKSDFYNGRRRDADRL